MDKLLTSPDVMFNTVYLASIIFIISTVLRAIFDAVSYHKRHRNIKNLTRALEVVIKKPVSKKKTVIKKSN